MASLANCPKCNHELLLPPLADAEAWAKCPACRAFFQPQEAATRMIDEAVVVGADAGPPIEAASTSGTLPDADNATAELAVSDLDRALPDAEPESSGPLPDEVEPAALSPAPPPEVAAWDDADQMARLLADVESPPAETPPPAADAEAFRGADRWEADSLLAEIARTTDEAEHEPLEQAPERVESWATTPSADVEESADLNQAAEFGDAYVAGFENAADLENATDLDEVASFDEPAQPAGLPDFPEPAPDDKAADQSRNAAAQAAAGIAVKTVSASRAPRRKSHIPRTLIGVALAGVVGTLAGCYALLWIAGPDGDVLGVAQYFPSSLLPAGFEQEPMSVAAAGRDADDPNQDPLPERSGGFDALGADDGAGEGAGDGATRPGYAEPAGYTPAAERDPPLAQDRAGRDRYDSVTPLPEPPAFDEPAAEPLTTNSGAASSAAIVGSPPVAGGGSYSPEQLAAALAAAEQAQAGLVDGDLSDPAVRRTKGLSYARLCDLAEAWTFASPAARSLAPGSAMARAESLVRETLADAHTRGEVARIVPIWIESPHRPHGGVFFGGTLASALPAGDIVECQVELGAGSPLTVLMPSDLAGRFANSSRPLAIVGTIVDSPAEHIAGYVGSAPRVVWAASVIPLD